MQHNRFGRKLRRSTSHRLAMFRNQLMAIVEHERIATTLYKAKELRPLVERVVTLGKNDSVAARRKVYSWVPSRPLVGKVFETLGPRFVDRPGGYTRILRLGRQRGDDAERAILEFVDFKFEAKAKAPKRESTMERARRSVSSRVETIRKDSGEEGEAAAAERPSGEKPAKSGRKGETASARGKAAPRKSEKAAAKQEPKAKPAKRTSSEGGGRKPSGTGRKSSGRGK